MNKTITVSVEVNAPIEKVWEYWTEPKHIIKWNFASLDWECPSAKNDLRVGGKFSCTMSAKDGSAGFDFEGTYTVVKNHELIEYIMTGEDKRKVSVRFTPTAHGVKVTETFDMEHENSEEMQRDGWLAILENFKKHVEETATRGLVAKAEININASLEKVWEALVTPAIIKQYMFGSTVVSSWKVGSAITWSGVWQGKPYSDKGNILKIEKEKVLSYNYFSPLMGKPDTLENYCVVTVKLSNVGKNTHLSLVQDNNATEQAREHSEKNWTLMLQSLKKIVEN